MKGLSRKSPRYVESTLARLAYIPVMVVLVIGIPRRGRVATVSFAEVLNDPAQLERQFQEIARLTFGDP